MKYVFIPLDPSADSTYACENPEHIGETRGDRRSIARWIMRRYRQNDVVVDMRICDECKEIFERGSEGEVEGEVEGA